MSLILSIIITVNVMSEDRTTHTEPIALFGEANYSLEKKLYKHRMF